MSEAESAGDDGDDRIIRETGIDARIALIVGPALRSVGFRLVRARLLAQNGLTLQVFAERPDGTMTVEDCEEASRAVSPALDVEDPVEKAYHLEMSSPGIDRPLVRKSDFAAWQGHLAKIETSILVADRKRFRGTIGPSDENGVEITRDQMAYGEAPVVRLPYETIAEARLVLTDDLVRDALSKDNQAKKQARKRPREIEDLGGPEEDAETAEAPDATN